MSIQTKEPWILVGYDLFAKHGSAGLKVEVIAREVKKSKSSFYHHFADVAIFTEVLLQYHVERSKLILAQEKLCKNIVPDLLHLLLEVKKDLLFNRQLRVHRHIPEFKDCFEKINESFEEVILQIWSDTLGLSDKKHLARIILKLAIENFFLQITEETLTYDWLHNYIKNLRAMVNEFQH